MDHDTSHSIDRNISHLPARLTAPTPTWPVWTGCLTLFALTLAIQMVVYWPTHASLIEHWTAHNRLGNVVLVIALSAYYLYANRKALSSCRPNLALTGVAAIAGFSLLWTAGNLINDNAVTGVAIIGMIHATCLAFFGRATLHLLRWPLAALWLLAPIDNAITPIVQAATFHATDFFLQSLLTYHYTEGFSIETAAASFAITPDTLGLPFLQTTLILALAIAFVLNFTIAGTIVFLAAGAAIVVIANAARIAITIATATLSNTPFAISTFDPATSWIAALSALYIAYQFAHRRTENSNLQFDQSVDAWHEKFIRTPRPAMPFLVGVICASLLLPGAYRAAHPMPTLPPVTLNIPDRIGHWIAQTEHQETRQVKNHPQTTFIKKFESENCCVELMIAYNWADTKALSHADITALFADNTDWRLIRSEKNTLPHDPIDNVNAAELASPTNQRLVWYFYWAGNKFISSAFDLGTQQFKNLLTHADRRNAIIAVSTSLSEGHTLAEQRLSSFLYGLPELQIYLKNAGIGGLPFQPAHAITPQQ